jgi:hypothetical protein
LRPAWPTARPYLKIKKKKSDIKGAGIPGIAAM